VKGEDLVPGWIDWMEAAAPGDYLLVTHPGSLDPEMLAWSVPGGTPGEVARERDAERRAWTDPRLRLAIRELGIQCLRYDELAGLPA
jgi:hypothetical protein